MPFIGNQPALSYTSFAKQDFTTSATTSYTLDNPVTNENEIALFINFVRQEPTTAYTASGTSLTLTSATSASDDMYCVFLGKAVQTVNPPSGSVGTAQIADLAVTSGKLASGVLPTNTPSFLAYASSNQTVGHESWTKVTLGTELFDTDSAFASNKFTVPTGEGGKYWFNGCVNAFAGANNLQRILMRLYKNGSGFAYLSSNDWNNQAYRDQETATGSTIIDLSAGDYIELYIWFSHASSGNTTIVGSSATEFLTKLSGYKIIE